MQNPTESDLVNDAYRDSQSFPVRINRHITSSRVCSSELKLDDAQSIQLSRKVSTPSSNFVPTLPPQPRQK